MTTNECKRSLELVKNVLADADLWFPMCHGTSTAFINYIMNLGLEPRQCTDTGFCRPSNWTGELVSRPDRVYLGHGQTAHCARASSKAQKEVGGLGVVLTVNDVPDKNNLDMDEDYVFRWKRLFAIGGGGIIDKRMLISDYKTRKEVCKKTQDPEKCIKIAFEFIYTPDDVDREVFEDDMVNVMEKCEPEEVHSFFEGLPDWSKSLAMMRTVGYKGTIPPELLSIEEDSQVHYNFKAVMEEVKKKTGNGQQK